MNRGEALSGFQAVLLIACGVFLIGYSMLAADSSNSQTQIIVSAVLLISGVIGLIVALSGGLMRWFSSAGVSPALSILVAALLLTLLGTGPEDPIAAALARGNGTLEPFKRFVEDPLDDPFCFKSASCGLHWSTASLVLITYFLIAAALHMFLATRLRRRRPSQWLFPLANAAVDLALAAIILLLAEKRDTWSLLSLVVGLHLLVGGGMLAAMAFIPHIPAAGPVRAVKG